MNLSKAVEAMIERGWDAYEQDGDSLIHFRLSLERMNQKTYDRINRDLIEIGWNKSWGSVGKGFQK